MSRAVVTALLQQKLEIHVATAPGKSNAGRIQHIAMLDVLREEGNDKRSKSGAGERSQEKESYPRACLV